MNKFASSLKRYRLKRELNQSELANTVGIKQGTIANYENGNRTPTIELLIKLAASLDVSVDRLLGLERRLVRNKAIEVDDDAAFINLIEEYLICKDGFKLLEAFKEYYSKYKNITHIFNNIITTTMYRIGELWEQGQISIADEHVASELMSRIIDWLTIQEIEAREDGPCAICSSISSEKHTLGIKMIASLFDIRGFRSIYIGNNLPTNELIEVISKENPRVLALSLTLRSHQDSLINMIKVLRDYDSFSSMDILVGGQGIKGMELIGLDNVHKIKDMDELDLWMKQSI